MTASTREPTLPNAAPDTVSDDRSDVISKTTSETGHEVPNQKSALVIGLGLYGKTLAIRLTELGWHVLAVDKKKEIVEEVLSQVSEGRSLDASDKEMLASLNPERFDFCICALGLESIEFITFTIFNLRELNAKRLICRSVSEDHDKLLSTLGARLIVNPEKSFAHTLSKKLDLGEFNTLSSSEECEVVLEVASEDIGLTSDNTAQHKEGLQEARRVTKRYYTLLTFALLALTIALTFAVSAQNAQLRALEVEEAWYQSRWFLSSVVTYFGLWSVLSVIGPRGMKST